MKRFHFLLLGFALCAAVAVGYTDSHEIKKDSIQVNDHVAFDAIQAVDLSAELPVFVALTAPDLGSPVSNYAVVSEKLAKVSLIRIRPPPEKVQKSDIKNNT